MSLVSTNLIGFRHRLIPQRYLCLRYLTSPAEENTVDLEESSPDANIENICNKSRLRPEHRNILFGSKPYSEPKTKDHTTVKYNRKLYGKYGSASELNPGIMWPTKGELKERLEYEEVAFPYTINQMVTQAKLEIEEKEKRNLEIQEKITANMAKLEMWKKQLRDTIAKKEAEALAAKEKKEKLLEEVRRHFGFTVDPREERFKEMLALKEKEMKKKEKQAKMEEREKKALAKLMETHKSDISS